MDRLLTQMFNDYAEERGFGARIHYTEFGFITYHIDLEEGQCYIEDLYVVPEFRKKRIASTLADYVCEVAKSYGIDSVIGSVNKLASNKELSRKALLGYGMEKVDEDEEMEWYLKEI